MLPRYTVRLFQVPAVTPSNIRRLNVIGKQLCHHPDAATGHCHFVRRHRFHTSFPMGRRIPAVFVDALKNACVWEQDWGFVVY